ncbi:MAG TPA: multidrug effflux MFS transporter [Halothiobacillus sp.]|nr:multidrug effflux MFS transporter [Halothiobacillus sp.]
MNTPAPRALLIVPLVASLLMLAPFTVDAYLPSFPTIAQEFGVDGAAMQQTLSIYLWFFGGLMLVHGPLSDTFGRKRTVLVALLVYALASVGAALAQSLSELIYARIGQGIAAGAGVVIGRALIRDLFQGATAQRVMSNVMLVFAAAPAVAPIVGGALEVVFGWRSVFWFLAGFAVLLIVGVARFMPETIGAHNRQPLALGFVLKSYGRALTHAPFIGLTLVFALLFSGLFLYIAAAPAVLIDHLGQSPTDFWKFFVPLVTGLILGSRVSNFLSRRATPLQTVTWGLVLTGLAVIYNLAQSFWFMSGDDSLWWTVSPITLYAMGMATAMPALNLMGLDYIPAQRGLASALQGFMQMALAGVVSGFVVARLSPHLTWLAMGMLVLWALAAILWGLWLQRAPKLGFASEGVGGFAK